MIAPTSLVSKVSELAQSIDNNRIDWGYLEVSEKVIFDQITELILDTYHSLDSETRELYTLAMMVMVSVENYVLKAKHE